MLGRLARAIAGLFKAAGHCPAGAESQNIHDFCG